MSSSTPYDATIISKPWREPPLWHEQVPFYLFLLYIYFLGHLYFLTFLYLGILNYFQNLQTLKDFVSNYKPLPDMEISEVNILLVGQINAGKSSFFNTLNSIFRGDISARACAGSSQHSLTTDVSEIMITSTICHFI